MNYTRFVAGTGLSTAFIEAKTRPPIHFDQNSVADLPIHSKLMTAMFTLLQPTNKYCLQSLKGKQRHSSIITRQTTGIG